MVFVSDFNPVIVLSILLGKYFPGLFGFSDLDVRGLFPFMKKVIGHSAKESGYLHLQATKPDTAGKTSPDGPV